MHVRWECQFVNNKKLLRSSGRKRIKHRHPTSKNRILDEMLDSFEHFHNFGNFKREGKKRKKSCWMKICPRTNFHPTFLRLKVQFYHVGFVWDKFPSNIKNISHLNATSNVLIIRMALEIIYKNQNKKLSFTLKEKKGTRYLALNTLNQRRNTIYNEFKVSGTILNISLNP